MSLALSSSAHSSAGSSVSPSVRPSARASLAALALMLGLAFTPAPSVATQAIAPGPAAATATTAAGAAVQAFVLDLDVDRTVVDAQGQPTEPPVTVRYRLSRVRTTRGWRLTLRFDPDADREPVTAASGPPTPFRGGWVEQDDDGTPPRIFDRHGDQVHARVPLEGLDAALRVTLDDTFVLRAEGRARRRDAVMQTFGPARGRQGTLDRFLRVDGTHTDELLLDPATAAPRSLSRIVEGRLEARTNYEYETRPSGDLLLRRTVTEARLPGVTDRRLRTRTVVRQLSPSVER